MAGGVRAYAYCLRIRDQMKFQQENEHMLNNKGTRLSVSRSEHMLKNKRPDEVPVGVQAYA